MSLISSSLKALERIKDLMFSTTVAQKLNQGTLPGLGCNQSRGPFLGTLEPAPMHIGGQTKRYGQLY